jgi:membrane-associated phospholipid phosphatase
VRKILLLSLICLFGTFSLSASKTPYNTLRRIGDFGQYATLLASGIVMLSKKDTEGLKDFAYAGTVHVVLHTMLQIATSVTSWGTRPTGNPNSFPSGHTGSAAFGAAFLQKRYGWAYGLPALAVTGLVGASRVLARKHHTRDVIAATALAYAVNYACVSRYETPRFEADIAPDRLGLRFRVNL